MVKDPLKSYIVSESNFSPVFFKMSSEKMKLLLIRDLDFNY
jgi:hypothetical protein